MIELLVVIAIIGILASVVLAALNNSQKKANDAKVKLQIEQIRTAAQLYYTQYNHYSPEDADDDSCDAPANDDSMFDDVTSNMDSLVDEDNYPPGTEVTCHHDADNDDDAIAFAVSATLSSSAPNDADNWCVDSTGASMAIASPLGNNDVTCN